MKIHIHSLIYSCIYLFVCLFVVCLYVCCICLLYLCVCLNMFKCFFLLIKTCSLSVCFSFVNNNTDVVCLLIKTQYNCSCYWNLY